MSVYFPRPRNRTVILMRIQFILSRQLLYIVLDNAYENLIITNEILISNSITENDKQLGNTAGS